MTSTTILALADDLMVVSRIEAAAAAIGGSVQFPKNERELKEAIEQREGTSLLFLVGMTATRQPWETLVPFARSVAGAEGVELRVIAFGPHMDLKLRQLALDAGVDEVIANSRLMTDLPTLLKSSIPTPEA
jgi:hypothetical protein